MTFLLDVNVLIAAIWNTHSEHARADSWMRGKSVALCPISELGFLRISSHPRGLGASMADAHRLLQDFWTQMNPQFIADDISARRVKAKSSDSLTDVYLAELASLHEMKLATFDRGIAHAGVEIID